MSSNAGLSADNNADLSKTSNAPQSLRNSAQQLQSNSADLSAASSATLSQKQCVLEALALEVIVVALEDLVGDVVEEVVVEEVVAMGEDTDGKDGLQVDLLDMVVDHLVMEDHLDLEEALLVDLVVVV